MGLSSFFIAQTPPPPTGGGFGSAKNSKVPIFGLELYVRICSRYNGFTSLGLKRERNNTKNTLEGSRSFRTLTFGSFSFLSTSSSSLPEWRDLFVVFKFTLSPVQSAHPTNQLAYQSKGKSLQFRPSERSHHSNSIQNTLSAQNAAAQARDRSGGRSV